MAAIHKALMRRFYDEAVNQGKLEVIEQILTPDFLDHNPPAPGLPPGAQGVQAAFHAFRAAFPDLHLELDDLISEGEMVCARYTMTATHRGDFMGIPASGRRVSISGSDIIRFDHGKAVERWGVQETLGLLQQLGVVPTAGQ